MYWRMNEEKVKPTKISLNGNFVGMRADINKNAGTAQIKIGVNIAAGNAESRGENYFFRRND
jgi:hypothetical protein